MHALHLSAQEAILLVRGVRGLLQFINLVLQIFQMLFLPLTERSLSRTVLGLAFLGGLA